MTTIDRVFAIAPELRDEYPAQSDTLTITADEVDTTATIDEEEYSISGTGKTKSEIATELAEAINAAQGDILTATAEAEVITLAAVTVGVGYTLTAGDNCTAVNEEENPEAVALVMTDVGRISAQAFGASYEEAQRYLAAHLLTVAAQEQANTPLGPVTAQSVGGVSVSFGSPTGGTTRYDSTKYGQRYKQLSRSTILRLGVY